MHGSLHHPEEKLHFDYSCLLIDVYDSLPPFDPYPCIVSHILVKSLYPFEYVPVRTEAYIFELAKRPGEPVLDKAKRPPMVTFTLLIGRPVVKSRHGILLVCFQDTWLWGWYTVVSECGMYTFSRSLYHSIYIHACMHMHTRTHVWHKLNCLYGTAYFVSIVYIFSYSHMSWLRLSHSIIACDFYIQKWIVHVYCWS